MSKQSESKEQQGYTNNAPCCQNCSNFSSKKEKVKSKWSSATFVKESGYRCNIGNFKVLKRSWCLDHSFCIQSED